MAELKQQYDEKLAQKEELKRKAEHTELMLDRASKLVSGLAGERIRWQETVKVGVLPPVMATLSYTIHNRDCRWFYTDIFCLSTAYNFTSDT